MGAGQLSLFNRQLPAATAWFSSVDHQPPSLMLQNRDLTDQTLLVCCRWTPDFSPQLVPLREGQRWRSGGHWCGLAGSFTVQVPHRSDYDIKQHLLFVPDITMECTGAQSCIAAAMQATASGGKVWRCTGVCVLGDGGIPRPPQVRGKTE